MHIEVTSCTVIKRSFKTDIVTLKTNLPTSVYPEYAPLDLQFFCANGEGEAYVATHFPGVPVRVIAAYYESKA